MGIKAKDIMELMKIYGEKTPLDSLFYKIRGDRAHVCRKCEGSGGEEVRYNAYPTGLPDSGWVEKWEYKFVECDLCDGHGYTREKYEPVVETKVLGYEVKKDE